MPRIRLIGSCNIPPVSGHDGHVIEVTEENQHVVETLVLVGSAKLLKDVDDEIVIVTTGPQAEKLSLDKIPPEVLKASADANQTNLSDQTNQTNLVTTPTGKLKRDSAIAELATLGIHGRYIKALSDANAKTIGELADSADKIVDVPGISPAAAEQIKTVIKENLAV